MSNLRVRPLAGAIGAEVEGVHLASLEDPADLASLRDALLTHGVIAVRDQQLSRDEQLSLQKNVYRPQRGNPSEISILQNSSERV